MASGEEELRKNRSDLLVNILWTFGKSALFFYVLVQ